MFSTNLPVRRALSTAGALAILAGCAGSPDPESPTTTDEAGGRAQVAVSKVDRASSLRDLSARSEVFVEAKVSGIQRLTVNKVDFARVALRVQNSSDPDLVGESIYVRQTDFTGLEPENMPSIMDQGETYLLALHDFRGPQEVKDEYVITFDEGIWEMGPNGPKNVATQSGAPIPELDITPAEAEGLLDE